MQQVLKVSTAATTVVGPILDINGAVYTGAVIADLNITKNGTTAAMAAAATLTHDHNGHYILVFTTGNTDTLGRLDITCNKATYAMPPKCFEVLNAATFDTLITNGTLASTTSGRTIVTDAAGLVDANAVKMGPTGSGTALTARDIGASVLLSSGTGTGQVSLSSGLVDITQAAADKVWSTTTRVLTAGTNINGSTFTAIPWNASWDAEVQSEVDDALIAKGLDHLVFTSVAGADVADDSIIAKLASKSATADWDTFNNTTDSHEALRDRGDAAWITATGFSTHTAADVWAVGTRLLTAGTNIVLAKGTGITGFNDLSAAQVNTEADTALSDVGLTSTITGRIDVAVSSRLAAAGYTAPLDAAGTRTAVGLATANLDTQLDALPTAAENAAGLLDLVDGVETGYTVRGTLRLIGAAVAGELSGAATTTVTIRNLADSKARITATVDSDGNRTAVTHDAT